MKKYGTQQLVGVNLNKDILSSEGVQPTINQLDNFTFNISDITHFRIYYDEGLNRKTKFKNEIGYFAIQGGLTTLENSGIKPTLENILSELSKFKFEKVDTFHSAINRNDANFIQINLAFRNNSTSLFLYLPIENGGKYANKIVLRQEEYANLGYEFILNQEDYPEIVKEFPKIATMNLEQFYLDKP